MQGELLQEASATLISTAAILMRRLRLQVSHYKQNVPVEQMHDVRGRRGERLASMIERVARAASSIAGQFHTLQGHAVRVPYRMISNVIA